MLSAYGTLCNACCVTHFRVRGLYQQDGEGSTMRLPLPRTVLIWKFSDSHSLPIPR